MRKWKRVLALLLPCLVLAAPVSVEAGNASTYTYTPSVDVGGYVHTQDAYQVTGVLLRETALNQPQDILVRDGICYIADTGNGRILVLDLETGEERELGNGQLMAPAGLFLTSQGELYVADRDAGEVVVFDPAGSEKKRLGRPKAATFGSDAVYRPFRVAVHDNGTIYVVSEGAYDGMIQLDPEGEFLGYFGYNNNPMTAWDYITDYFFTDEMKAQLTNRVPYSFRSVDMDAKGMLYTVTQAAEGNALKKHDVAGRDLLRGVRIDEPDFVDVCLGPEGTIYAVTGTGLLFEYDEDGELMFTFGGRAISTERNGIFTTVSAISCDGEGRLYVLDAERGFVHVMKPTDFARSYHEAMGLYRQGRYEECAGLWEHLKAVGGTNAYVEYSLGECLYELGRYEEAAACYRTGGFSEGYSKAYWQIRNLQIAKAAPYLLGALALLWILWFLYRRFLQKKDREHKPNIWREDFQLVFAVLRHPIDSFYAIRNEGKGHMVTALALYAVEYLLFVAYNLGAGFLLIGNSAKDASLLFLTVMFWIPAGLFVGSNFLVCEVGEGKARFRDVFISTAYVMGPFAVIMPLFLLISHIVTLNELPILNLVTVAMLLWIVINLLIATREIHSFETGEAIRHLLITAFLMAMAVLAASLIYMLCDQLADVVFSVIKEVNYRVFLS